MSVAASKSNGTEFTSLPLTPDPAFLTQLSGLLDEDFAIFDEEKEDIDLMKAITPFIILVILGTFTPAAGQGAPAGDVSNRVIRVQIPSVDFAELIQWPQPQSFAKLG